MISQIHERNSYYQSELGLELDDWESFKYMIPSMIPKRQIQTCYFELCSGGPKQSNKNTSTMLLVIKPLVFTLTIVLSFMK